MPEFQKAVAALGSADWPAPIIEFYLGKRSAADMAAAADDAERRCDVQFYLGEWYWLENKREEAVKALRAAVLARDMDSPRGPRATAPDKRDNRPVIGAHFGCDPSRIMAFPEVGAVHRTVQEQP